MNHNSLSDTLLLNLGIQELNSMQEAAQTAILNDPNVLLLSPTGSGKTLAFLLPIYQMLEVDKKGVQALILVPSRELGLQIEQVWKKMNTAFKANVCYGGHSFEIELKNLSTPPALLIGTPGRIADHLDRESFDTKNIQTFVLDEFDKSLQLGFHEEMSYIIKRLPKINKRILVSATAAVEIPKFTGVNYPTVLDFTEEEKINENLATRIVVSPSKDKVETLFQLICSLQSEAAIIFCNHREAVERVYDWLTKKGIIATFYHGGLNQDERERALIQFRNKSVSYLITTDLGARGLDIPEMKHVIHYHLPVKEEDFIHRNGRTARMLATGTAYVLVTEAEKKVDYFDYDGFVLDVSKAKKLPEDPLFQTLYISGGKKNKLNKVDIVGFLSQKANLGKEDIGLIEVKDFISFAAIRSNKIQPTLLKIKDQKIKGKKYKIEVARSVVKRE
ncbi:DEAD/DEAH box helicase [Flavobacterium sp. TP390]|uniref:DEAD/DEAH box helicase n=1 Tax=Flavobacterium profundi TaxID=1774945 RepID=A0A6I4IW09_9FLAO|nr:DEAD/DEAH box helicase [Flavobacterium profundi]MVO10698.1 DEAD/DEAH box helicase [Flavobacterium profundi]